MGQKSAKRSHFSPPQQLAEPMKKSPGIGSIPKNRKKHREMSRKLCRNHRGKHLYYINILYIYISYIKNNLKWENIWKNGMSWIEKHVHHCYSNGFDENLPSVRGKLPAASVPTRLQPPATAWQMRRESRSHYKWSRLRVTCSQSLEIFKHISSFPLFGSSMIFPFPPRNWRG